ncbi:M23 family metallopeptidase [Planktothrix sp. FACHB-1355]|uniref:M23 family metallopeptidase n=1 Tax=Aerosakkonema funiforme FACHB-1375 TaxID=2949571 RepID=A0A926ZKE8_9CYAN|nr:MULTISPECIES: M23 family metallopeptidase [Oscillatoriales]MBD2185709.1 M23 family metallopeptidase [Aerosakkonema funiforme FACHB-1375]MBD3561341.1 M23 family metallopeptidase [Planktothrix sp. FACHB-1355]
MALHRWFPLLSTLLWLTVTVWGAKADPELPAAKNDNCPQPALERLKKHIVAAGETIESIASKYDLIPATLMGMNPSLRQGEARVGSEIIIPPYNGIALEVPEGKTWRDLAAGYNVRPAVVYEVNGCEENPRVVFLPGVNWSPEGTDVEFESALKGYPLPTQTTVGFAFGWNLHPITRKVVFHGGVDLLAEPGTPVFAAGDGIVAFAGERGDYGNLVVINHQEGQQTRYAHLDTIAVSAGQTIQQGMQLGTVGTTGFPDIELPHLHFEVRYNSDLGWVAEDPKRYLQAAARQGDAMFSRQQTTQVEQR